MLFKEIVNRRTDGRTHARTDGRTTDITKNQEGSQKQVLRWAENTYTLTQTVLPLEEVNCDDAIISDAPSLMVEVISVHWPSSRVYNCKQYILT